jgi:hypothetical protein
MGTATSPSYFTTEDEKFAVMGRVSAEYAETKRHLAALKAEAERLCKIFQELATALRQPTWVTFDDEPIPPGIKTYEGYKVRDHAFPSSSIDGVKLKSLCNEIRQTSLKLDSLSEKMKSLGL